MDLLPLELLPSTRGNLPHRTYAIWTCSLWNYRLQRRTYYQGLTAIKGIYWNYCLKRTYYHTFQLDSNNHSKISQRTEWNWVSLCFLSWPLKTPSLEKTRYFFVFCWVQVCYQLRILRPLLKSLRRVKQGTFMFLYLTSSASPRLAWVPFQPFKLRHSEEDYFFILFDP